MSTYNVRLYKYYSGQQMRIYKNPIQADKPTKYKISEITKEDREILVSLGWIKKDSIYLVKPMREKRYMSERTLKQIIHSQYVSRCRTINKVYEYSRANKWEYFITVV